MDINTKLIQYDYLNLYTSFTDNTITCPAFHE
jgi:hypothetical protein